jgi:hypothetical protein
MKAGLGKKSGFKLPRLLKKDGAFLLEAMIGTAIFSIVMVFFATVSISAFMLMQRAYWETEVTEAAFQKVESRRYSELTTDKSTLPITGGSQFIMGELDESESSDHDYVKYVAADGAEGGLDSLEIASSNSKPLFSNDLYAFLYKETRGEYSAVFFILKGEK